MPKFMVIIVLFFQIFVFSPSIASNTFSAGYRYHVATHDYQRSFLTYALEAGQSKISFLYDRADGMNPEYSTLQNVALSYLYMDDRHLFGAVGGSGSDRPFDSIDVMDIMGFYGYNVYSKVLGKAEITLPDGTPYTYERKTHLYLGIGGASKPLFFGTYFVPVISYIYHGEKLIFRLGLPATMVSYAPHKMHRFALLIGFTNAGIQYEFTPTRKDKFLLEYKQEETSYRLSDQPTGNNNRNYRLTYQRNWYRAAYSHTFSGVTEVGVSAGYMPLGYVFKGKYYHSGPSGKLPVETQYGIFASVSF